MGGYLYLSIHGKDIQLLIPQASSSTVRRNVVCFTQVPFCGGYTCVVMAKVVSGCWIPTLWSCFPFFATSGSAETGTKTYRRLSRYVWEEPCNSNLVYYQTRSVIDTKHVTGTFRLLEHISRQTDSPGNQTLTQHSFPGWLQPNDPQWIPQSEAGRKSSSHLRSHSVESLSSRAFPVLSVCYRYQDVWG